MLPPSSMVGIKCLTRRLRANDLTDEKTTKLGKAQDHELSSQVKSQKLIRMKKKVGLTNLLN